MQKTLKASLICRGNSWLDDLPFVLLGLRTAIKEGSGLSPADSIGVFSEHQHARRILLCRHGYGPYFFAVVHKSMMYRLLPKSR
jgi:hypothetical protein